MATEELAPEVEETEGDEAHDIDSSSGSMEDDFKAIFGDAEPADSEGDEEDGDEESTSDTVKRVFKEAEAENTGQTPQAEQQQPQELQQQQESSSSVVQDGVTPPARFSPEAKKMFSNIKSKTLRKEIQRTVKDLETGQVKAINEEKQKLSQVLQQEARKLHHHYTQEVQKVAGMQAAIEPYIDKLTFNGKMPLSQSIGELAATHAKLSSDKPEVAIPELKRIAGYLSKRFKQPPEALLGLANSATVQNDQTIQTLQQQLQHVTSELNRIKAQPQIDHIRSEVEAARQERDEAGRHLWPELHDSNFLVRVNPLVEQIMRANPGMSYGNAHKQAVLISRGTPQVHQAPRLPAATTTNKPSGVSSGSVRGRSANSSGQVDIIKDAPKTGSIREDWDYIRRSM